MYVIQYFLFFFQNCCSVVIISFIRPVHKLLITGQMSILQTFNIVQNLSCVFSIMVLISKAIYKVMMTNIT